MACLVNVEGQLPRLPQPQPPAPLFEWALAQDWTVLAQADVSGGPDVQVMGGKGHGVAADVLPRAAAGRGRRAAPSGAGATAASRAVPAGVQGSAFAQFVAARPATPVGQALDGAGALEQTDRRRAVDQGRAAVAGHADDRRRRARPRRQAPGARHHGHRLSPADPAARAGEGLPLPGARALVVHHQRRRHLRDADAGPRRRPARHRAEPDAEEGAAARPARPAAAAAGARRPGDRRDRPHRSGPHARAAAMRCAPGTAGRACRSRRRATAARSRTHLPPRPCRWRTAPINCGASIPDGREDLALAAAFEIGRLLGAIAAVGGVGADALSCRAVRRRARARAAGAGARLPAAGPGRCSASAAGPGALRRARDGGHPGAEPGGDARPAPPHCRPRPPARGQGRTRRGDRRPASASTWRR